MSRLNRTTLAALLLTSLFLRALIPVGYMPIATAGQLQMAWCGVGNSPAPALKLTVEDTAALERCEIGFAVGMSAITTASLNVEIAPGVAPRHPDLALPQAAAAHRWEHRVRGPPQASIQLT